MSIDRRKGRERREEDARRVRVSRPVVNRELLAVDVHRPGVVLVVTREAATTTLVSSIREKRERETHDRIPYSLRNSFSSSMRSRMRRRRSSLAKARRRRSPFPLTIDRRKRGRSASVESEETTSTYATCWRCSSPTTSCDWRGTNPCAS
jgi:hypothetical protein